METLNDKIVTKYFKEIIDTFPVQEDLESIVVTHLLTDRHYFLNAVNKIAKIKSIIPKPKSIIPNVYNWIKHQYQVDKLSREDVSSVNNFRPYFDSVTNEKSRVVFLDIGGYFSKISNELKEIYRDRIIGVVEDTENGTQKYEAVGDYNLPVISVARSPLKKPEDFLVGQSIVFSVEALLRDQGDIIQGRTACVIGYGKIGRSIANLLISRHVRVVVHDINLVTTVEAMSHGFTVAPTLKKALKGAGLIFCATGNISLKEEDYPLLENGAYIATVTSSEDELDIDGLKKSYSYCHVSNLVTRYTNKSHEFYLLNRGQAVNFIHGAAVGPFIYLIQGEILASISVLLNNRAKNEIFENGQILREVIADIWLKNFAPFYKKKHKDD